MEWQWVKFEDLSPALLYEVLALRQKVFIVEQNCPYLDTDGLDCKAWHLLGWVGPGYSQKERFLGAYARVFPGGVRFSEPSIGRVVTALEVRRKGIGKVLMVEAMTRLREQLGNQAIRISAQAYLQKFYQDLGFVPVSSVYMEDGIPHLEMLASSLGSQK
jgi:ElaA protein